MKYDAFVCGPKTWEETGDTDSYCVVEIVGGRLTAKQYGTNVPNVAALMEVYLDHLGTSETTPSGR